ncbi:MAG TPA: chorismate synthase [Papillibacter sp.]|nr:chorismate synthase [Papillibacter sp.]
MSSIFGNSIKVSIFGQSHSPAIGVVIDGLPAGFAPDFDQLRQFMLRRAPGRSRHATARREADEPEILSGLVGGVTCGAPLAAVIRNTDARSGDYENLRDVPRPSHADFAAQAKFRGAQDIAGGGHFSGRLTAPLCFAGGLCLQLLAAEGVSVGAHIASIGTESDRPFSPLGEDAETLRRLTELDFPVLDAERGEAMQSVIDEARNAGDSVGGVIECIVMGLPAGIGNPMFDGLENRITAAVFAVPAVKGIEFGSGFDGARLRGSENNDAFYTDGCVVRTETNNHGGILGGISSGMPILFRVAMKPTPSIALPQRSVRLTDKTNVRLTIKGRHDPCIVPRAVPVIEAAAALALYDALLCSKTEK